MSARGESTEIVLADRLVGYSDALVAVSFLSVSGIGLAVADADTRCTVAHGAHFVMFGTFMNGVIFSAIIVFLRRWERNLRADEPPSETASRYMELLHVARLVILWVSVVIAMALANESRDGACSLEGTPISTAAQAAPSACDQPFVGEAWAESISPARAPVG